MGDGEIHLTWRRFDRMTKACKEFHTTACVYVIADVTGIPLYIGSTEALGDRRYRGGTASAFDAALHSSGNMIFVAEILVAQCVGIEKALIWAEKPQYNRQGKIIPELAGGHDLHPPRRRTELFAHGYLGRRPRA